MKKKLLIATMVVCLAACSGDGDGSSEWAMDRNVVKSDLVGNMYQSSKGVTILVYPTDPDCIRVTSSSSHTIGSFPYALDGDSIRFTAKKAATHARMVKYSEYEKPSLVLSHDDNNTKVPVKSGIYKYAGTCE